MNIKTLLLFLAFLYTHPAVAGPGGLSGGNTQGFQKGDKIHFQRHSTWVSVLYNKSLCHDGQDYWAEIRTCAIRANDNEDCLRFQKIKVKQPLLSTRKRCERYTHNRCENWEQVPYVQKPKRLILKDRQHRQREGIKKIVPRCF